MNTRDAWVKSARLYIHSENEECGCDCWLCIGGEHDEHCEFVDEYEAIYNPLS